MTEGVAPFCHPSPENPSEAAHNKFHRSAYNRGIETDNRNVELAECAEHKLQVQE